MIERKITIIADHYGTEAQLVKLAEECAELAQAALKYRADVTAINRDHIIEEIADVGILVDQIKHRLNIGHEETDAVRDYKPRRQMERIYRGA